MVIRFSHFTADAYASPEEAPSGVAGSMRNWVGSLPIRLVFPVIMAMIVFEICH